MKNHLLIFILLNILFSFCSNAQGDSDTLIIQQPLDTIASVNQFKLKIGAKFMMEKGTDYSIMQYDVPVFSGGVQVVRAIGSSPSSIETGLYLVTKASAYKYNSGKYIVEYNEYSVDSFALETTILFNYYNLSIPINYRYNLSFAYLSGGVMIDYLVGETTDGVKSHLEKIHYKPEQMRKLNWGYNLAVGAERNFSKRMRLIVELRFAETMSSSKTTNGVFFSSPSYRNWGLAIGTNYKLY